MAAATPPYPSAASQPVQPILIATSLVLIQVALLATGPRHDREPPPAWALRVDPNVASRAELMSLPRVGPALADAIIAYRTERGGAAFRTADDLLAVPRIGPQTVALLREFLRFPDDPAAAGR